jgi:hypothetical protein
MTIVNNFEQLVEYKAKRMAKAASWKDQASSLSCDFKAFKVGGWDAMIYDMAFSLGVQRYATRKFRERLIKKWLAKAL